MKEILLLLVLISCGIFAGCGGGSGSKEPKFEIIGEIIIAGDSVPYYSGVVKNTGDSSAWWVMLTFTIYEDPEHAKIIGTDWIYLADGQEIAPGQSCAFKIKIINLDGLAENKLPTKEDLKYYSYKIIPLKHQ